MSPLVSIRLYWQKIITIVDNLPANDDDKNRLKHFIVFSLFGVPTMLIYGLYNLFENNFILAIIIGISSVSLVAGCVFQYRFPKTKLVFRICAVIYSILLLYMFAGYSEGGSKALWLYTFPLIVFFLMGKIEGGLWALVLLLLVIILYVVPLAPKSIYPYSHAFMIRLITTYSIISGVTYWYEHFRSNYQQQIQEGNRRFLEIMENSQDILYRRDLKTGKYQFISKAFYKQLGYTRSDILSLSYEKIGKLIHPEDQVKHDEYLVEILSKLPEENSDREIEYRMRHKDGRYLWFRDKLAVIRDGYGKPEFIIGSNRENTTFRQTSQALKKANDQLFTIFNGIDAHIYVADMDNYQILFMNDKMQRDFGKNIEGKICWKEFRNSQGPCEHCTNEELLDQYDNPTGLFEWECFNPIVKRWYNNYDRAIQWVDGRMVRLQISLDITRMKEMEEERKRNEDVVRRASQLEAIGNLAGGIAHDFNNLLQIIFGNLGILEEDKVLTSTTKQHLEEIDKAAVKASELANRLVTFSSGGSPLKEPADVTFLIESVVKEVVNVSSIQCDISSDHSLLQSLIDYNQMRIALANLLVNACESMPDGGQLKISTTHYVLGETRKSEEDFIPEGKYVKISIQDSGSGIPESVLTKIFDPYYSTKQMGAQKGLGLGLSIVYSIIKRHDGFITIQSMEGKGTIVHIYLVAYEGETDTVVREGTTPLKHDLVEDNKILVMDDELMILKLSESLFSKLGYHVDTARDGQIAVDLYNNLLEQGKRYKLVILDLTVTDGMGGKQTLEKLLEIDAGVQAVVSSGYSSDPIVTDFKAHGFIDSLTKPYTTIELSTMLKRHEVNS